ncbi:MAG: potassium transporter Kup [Solirubrobacterales bacterium]|nr:potassium transporter Kup [Solirubrobacterales bacterium]
MGRKRTAVAGPGAPAMGVLVLGALGVVFGDIGTSPLYALQAVFAADHGAVKPTEGDVYGVISLVFWTITLIVSVKFVTFIMRADNQGEGGIMALIALVQRAHLGNRRVKALLVAAGLVGVALFYGDGMITPAISVLSAVEGVEVSSPGLSGAVIPITIVILTLLFALQRFGTRVIGRMFGPVMAVWFLVIGLAGLVRVIGDPEILSALLPSRGVDFFTAHPGIAFISLGAIVLTITGAEALYADMGHFGREPIKRAWFLLVFPALTLNYLGQGSLIVSQPETIANPFFHLFPDWSHLPMVVLATAATVIASQAVISGAFSVTRQAVQLGFLPRLTVRQTAPEEIGQIYVPAVNWILFPAVLLLVVGFRSSTNLAAAYGIAVIGTLTIDTLLFLVVARSLWRRPLWLVLIGGACFLTVDLAFFSASLTKVLHGGWFPLLVAAIAFTLLATWARGHEVTTRIRVEEEGPLRDFVAEVRDESRRATRVPGTAIYLNSRRHTTPLALRNGLVRDHVIHEQVVVLTVLTTRMPYSSPDRRLTLEESSDPSVGIVHLTAHLGFMETPDVPALLAVGNRLGEWEPIDLDGAYYYLSSVITTPGGTSHMARWRKRLFSTMARNASDPVAFFRLPATRTVIEGSEILI